MSFELLFVHRRFTASSNSILLEVHITDYCTSSVAILFLQTFNRTCATKPTFSRFSYDIMCVFPNQTSTTSQVTRTIESHQSASGLFMCLHGQNLTIYHWTIACLNFEYNKFCVKSSVCPSLWWVSEESIAYWRKDALKTRQPLTGQSLWGSPKEKV